MANKSLIVHGCWAAAVLAGFGLGTLRRSPEAGGALDRGGDAPSSLSAARLRMAGPEGAADREGDALGRDRKAGALARVFGDPRVLGEDLELLARDALRDPNPVTRRLAFARLLESMTPENALAIREQMVELGAGGDEWRDFNYGWGALAGAEAFAFATNSEERDMDSVLTGWAAANPAEAIALLDNLPENLRENRDRLAQNVVAGLADQDRGLASDLVLRLAGEGMERADRLMQIVANEAMRADGPEEAARWSETLPDGRLKGAAMDRIAGEFVDRDPEAAALWAQNFADQEYAVGMIEEIGGEWAERSPADAVSWLESLPQGNGQIAGLRSAFGDWEDRDPVAAGEYLMSMPQSAQRDSAISGFSTGYAREDPEVAIAWAQEISDPGLREESLARVGQSYFQQDPVSARAWLESSGLPPEIQQAVMNPRRRNR